MVAEMKQDAATIRKASLKYDMSQHLHPVCILTSFCLFLLFASQAMVQSTELHATAGGDVLAMNQMTVR